MDAIKTVKLTKNYKDLTAVDGLNLTVRQGELLSLLGVNGAGKTTTIKMLTSLTRPTSGDAFLNGKSILTDSAAVKNMIAVSPQETAVAPNLTVWENLELMAGVHGFSKDEAKNKVAELSSRFGLGEVANKRTGKLSDGWQRRLSIAMALLFVSLGLLCGSIFTDKQVGGICGALLTNLTAWLSGIWFDLGLVGGAFQKIANLLPFVHAVEMERAVLRGDYAGVFPHIWWVMGYAAAVTAIAVFAFLRQMKRQ